MNRIEFIKNYLELFGVVEIDVKKVSSDCIVGIAIYDDSFTSEDNQMFILRMREGELLSEDAINLISMMRKYDLLDIDRIKVSSEELCRRYRKEFNRKKSIGFDINLFRN